MILRNRLTINISWLINGNLLLPVSWFFGVKLRQQGAQTFAVGEDQVGGNFKQRPEHKAAAFHVVMRHGQAFGVNHRITKQHDIQIEGARSPALFFTHAPLLQLNALGVVQQRVGAKGGFQRNGGDTEPGLRVGGQGGIYTEVFRDVSRDLVPVDGTAALAMLESLKIRPLLRGTRGEQGVDTDALVEAIERLSFFASENPGIAELDINPLMAAAAGCRAVDARILWG